MNIVVLGQGAIGSLWLYHLTKIKQLHPTLNVSVINNYQQINSAAFTNFGGLSHQYPVQIATKEQLASADLLLVCLKATNCALTLNELTKQISTSTDIVLSHNGMGVVEAIDEQLKSKCNIFTLLTTHGCFRASNYHVIHTGLGHCDLGYAAKQNICSPPQWLDVLNSALPKVLWQDDILEKQWLKLAINCVINPLTAIHKVKNGEITNAGFITDIEHIANEVSQAAHSQGVPLSSETIVKQSLSVAKNTANNTSSMLSDVLAGKPTEIAHINGYIASIGKKLDLPHEKNEWLTKTITSYSL